MDIFDNTILCRNCGKEMTPEIIIKDGFKLRVVRCDCGNVIIHPEDKIRYEKFRAMRKKDFDVKLRMVGNSYAVSIPKQIIEFMQKQEKMMNDIVRLHFEEPKKLSLVFGERVKKRITVRDGVQITEVERMTSKNGKQEKESYKEIKDLKTGKKIIKKKE